MAWKLGENGNLAMDDKGNPIWTNDAGEDKSVDYIAMSTHLAEANKKARDRKEELRNLNEKLAIFEGVEDLSAWKIDEEKALEAMKNSPEKDKEIQARLEAALAPKDKAIAERDQTIAQPMHKNKILSN